MTNRQIGKVSAGTRVYYFDINEDRKGQRYLAISEIPTDLHPGNKGRRRIFVHADNIDRFLEAMKTAAAELGNVSKR